VYIARHQGSKCQMSQLAIAVLSVLCAFLFGQAALTLGFVWVLRRCRYSHLPDRACPKVAVVLCVRGKDPFLTDCLEALLHQDYPNYDARVIVDHADDPALGVVQEWFEASNAPNVRWELLQDRRDTCSLKCSSLVQAARQLDSSYEAIALLDADTVPHSSWLRELIAPLLDERCGASTGNRWYMPAAPSVGATARYFWNVFAIVQMYWLRIAWGGSLAVKMDVVRKSDLLRSWSEAFCEDTMLYSVLRKQALRLAFVPSLTMINREDCGLGNYYRWVRRQLLTARLYHPLWNAVVFHGLLSTILPLFLIALFTAAVVTENRQITAWVIAAALLYVVVLSLLLWPLEASVRRFVAQRGEPTAWMSWQFFVSCVSAIPLLQILYPMALASALLSRRVEWRGVEYQIDGPWRIRLVEYRPYQMTGDKATISL